MTFDEALDVEDISRLEARAEIMAHGVSWWDFLQDTTPDGAEPDTWRGETVLAWLGY